MVSILKKLIESSSNFFGKELILSGYKKEIVIYREFPPYMEKDFMKIYKRCKDYTTTSIERMYALYKAVEYIVKSNIKGNFVECGVWKGGSTMIIALTLLSMKEKNRKIYLYDTFSGMTKPTEKDKTISSSYPVIDKWKKYQANDHNKWAFSPLEDVKDNMLSTGYPPLNLVFVKGKVEDTIPRIIPSKIALLRLDTDWYESTYHELKYLFPLLINKGVLVIDDYGYFTGAKEAVDKYVKENNIKILLNRIDYTGRLGIKYV